MSTTLGRTFLCFADLTSRFAVAQTDREIARDEVDHRLTCNTVLGSTDAALSFGLDVRSQLGAAMTDDDIASLGPLLSSVLQRSGRLNTADVKVTRGTSAHGLLSLLFDISVTMITGETFSFLFQLSGSTFEQVGAT